MGNLNNSYFSQNFARMMERTCSMRGVVDDCVQNCSRYDCREEVMLRIEAEVKR